MELFNHVSRKTQLSSYLLKLDLFKCWIAKWKTTESDRTKNTVERWNTDTYLLYFAVAKVEKLEVGGDKEEKWKKSSRL